MVSMDTFLQGISDGRIFKQQSRVTMIDIAWTVKLSKPSGKPLCKFRWHAKSKVFWGKWPQQSTPLEKKNDLELFNNGNIPFTTKESASPCPILLYFLKTHLINTARHSRSSDTSSYWLIMFNLVFISVSCPSRCKSSLLDYH